LANLPA